MRRSFLLVVLAAAALLLEPTPVLGKVVSTNCSGNGGGQEIGAKKYSESFIAPATGKLTNGFVESWKAGQFIVEIFNADASGRPIGSSLASDVLMSASAGYEFLYPMFDVPAKVKAGSVYAIVVTVPDAATTGVLYLPNEVCTGAHFVDTTGTAGWTAATAGRDMDFSISVKVRHRRR